MDDVQSPDRIRDVGNSRNADRRAERQDREIEQKRAEASDFLISLERRIVSLRASGSVLEGDSASPPRFIDYARTRNLTSECMAFMLVIGRRIDALPETVAIPLRDVFRRHTVAMWSTLLDCSLTFMRAIAEEEHLPLGSREVFLREIKTLHDAHTTLSDPEFAGLVSEDTLSKQGQAEKILSEIIERAPRLLDLGG
jgi:hypothetical protein